MGRMKVKIKGMQVMKTQMISRVERKKRIILRVPKTQKISRVERKEKIIWLRVMKIPRRSRVERKGKSDGKNTNNETLDASELWLSGSKTR